MIVPHPRQCGINHHIDVNVLRDFLGFNVRRVLNLEHGISEQISAFVLLQRLNGREISVYAKMDFTEITVSHVLLLEHGISNRMSAFAQLLKQCGTVLSVSVQLVSMVISASHVQLLVTGILNPISVSAMTLSCGMVLGVHVLSLSSCTNQCVSSVQMDITGLIIDVRSVIVPLLIFKCWDKIAQRRRQRVEVFSINVRRISN